MCLFHGHWAVTGQWNEKKLIRGSSWNMLPKSTTSGTGVNSAQCWCEMSCRSRNETARWCRGHTNLFLAFRSYAKRCLVRYYRYYQKFHLSMTLKREPLNIKHSWQWCWEKHLKSRGEVQTANSTSNISGRSLLVSARQHQTTFSTHYHNMDL